MRTGEKTVEYREMNHASRWMERRLFNSDGSIRDYRYVQIRHGYQAGPQFRFTCEFLGLATGPVDVTYSNGLRVDSKVPMFHIQLGNIVTFD